MSSSPSRRAASAALALLAALLPSLAGADFGASLQTVARTLDVLQDVPGLQRVRSWRSIDQGARLTWDDLGEREAWTVDLSVRGRLDWGTGADRGAEDQDFDVLIARAGWRSRRGLVGLQLGRIQSITGFGWKAYDGARLDFGKLPTLRVHCFAGAPVDLAVNGPPDLGGFTWGAGVTGIVPRHGSVSVDYELRKLDEDTSEETAGLDLSLRFARTQVSANADYSFPLDVFGETAVVIGQDLGSRSGHHVEARATRVTPIWTADPLFAVFDINPYDELRVSYERRGERFSVGAYASREDYEDTGVDGPEDVARAAVTGRWKGLKAARGLLNRSEIGWLDGWTGARLALRHDSDWNVMPRLRIGFGGSMQDFRNFARLDERDQIWSLRARVRHDHFGKWDLSFEVEQFFGRDRDSTRGLLAFGTRFGSARRERPWWGGRIGDGAERTPVAPRSGEKTSESSEASPR